MYKIYLFSLFSDKELRELQRINIFIMRLYIKYWFECTIPTKAAINDLQLYKDLIEYEAIDKILAEAILQVFSRHLWYLSESLVGLSFFNNNISLEEKRIMVSALKKPGYDENPKKAVINKQRANQLDLSDFISENTLHFFNAVCDKSSDVSAQEFLEINPKDWHTNNSYLRVKLKVDEMLIVNDVAERAIAMVSTFNDKLTKNEDEKQLLFQVVEHYRNEFPNKMTKLQMMNKLT